MKKTKEQKKIEPKIGWYAFENGNFSPDPKAYDELLGVVAWVNPDPLVRSGSRGLIVSLEEIVIPWADKSWLTRVKGRSRGRINTQKLIDLGKEHHCVFYAANYCWTYAEKKTLTVQSFLPASTQWIEVMDNLGDVNKSLTYLHAPLLEGDYWSSTEHNDTHVWTCSTVDFGRYAWKGEMRKARCFWAF